VTYRIKVPAKDGKPDTWVRYYGGIYTLRTDPEDATAFQIEAVARMTMDLAPLQIRFDAVVEEWPIRNGIGGTG
jgi:hypothetical protein